MWGATHRQYQSMCKGVMGYRNAIIYAFAVTHNIYRIRTYAPGTRSGGGPFGLPSGGSGEGCTIGGGPLGFPSGPWPVAAIRLAGTEMVARSSVTARQRRLIFTCEFPFHCGITA